MKVINYEMALQAITSNLDRINNTEEGTMSGVAKNWLKGLPVFEVEDNEI